MRIKKSGVIAVLALFAFVFSSAKPRDLKAVVLDDLIKETQFSLEQNNSDVMRLVWWIPTEFWSVVYAQDESVDEETAADIVDALDDYTIILVIDGDVGTFGEFKPRNAKDVKRNLTVFDNENKEFEAIDETDINFQALMFINMLKPILGNLLGPMGESMNVLVFEKEDEKILDPYLEGGHIQYDKEVLNLDLPLASLLQDKLCPVDKEPMNAKWKYCPYHGKDLE